MQLLCCVWQTSTCNRRSGTQVGVPVDPGHRVGSISTMEVVERLTQSNEGVVPSAARAFMMSHSVPTEDGQRKIISSKAQKMWETYENKMQQYEEQGIHKSEDEVFYEVVGGRKHGVVYGLGSSADLYYKKASSRSSMSTASYTPSIMYQLEERVKKAEEIAEKANERAENVEKAVVESRSQMVELLRKMEEFISAASTIPNQVRGTCDP